MRTFEQVRELVEMQLKEYLSRHNPSKRNDLFAKARIFISPPVQLTEVQINTISKAINELATLNAADENDNSNKHGQYQSLWDYFTNLRKQEKDPNLKELFWYCRSTVKHAYAKESRELKDFQKYIQKEIENFIKNNKILKTSAYGALLEVLKNNIDKASAIAHEQNKNQLSGTLESVMLSAIIEAINIDKDNQEEYHQAVIDLLNLFKIHIQNNEEYKKRGYQLGNPDKRPSDMPVSPFEGNEVSVREKLNENFDTFFENIKSLSLVYVSGKFDHSVLRVDSNDNTVCYIHINGMHHYPEHMTEDEFHNYMMRWGKVVDGTQDIRIPDMQKSQQKLKEFCSKRWFNPLVTHNCFNFAQDVVKAGGGNISHIKSKLTAIPKKKLRKLHNAHSNLLISNISVGNDSVDLDKNVENHDIIKFLRSYKRENTVFESIIQLHDSIAPKNENNQFNYLISIVNIMDLLDKWQNDPNKNTFGHRRDTARNFLKVCYKIISEITELQLGTINNEDLKKAFNENLNTLKREVELASKIGGREKVTFTLHQEDRQKISKLAKNIAMNIEALIGSLAPNQNNNNWP